MNFGLWQCKRLKQFERNNMWKLVPKPEHQSIKAQNGYLKIKLMNLV